MTTGPARALLRRFGLFLDGFSACFSRQPQREAATQYVDGPSEAFRDIIPVGYCPEVLP